MVDQGRPVCMLSEPASDAPAEAHAACTPSAGSPRSPFDGVREAPCSLVVPQSSPETRENKKPRLVTEAKCLILWCRCPESNWGPTHYECAALPTELQRHGAGYRQCRSAILAAVPAFWNPLCVGAKRRLRPPRQPGAMPDASRAVPASTWPVAGSWRSTCGFLRGLPRPSCPGRRRRSASSPPRGWR